MAGLWSHTHLRNLNETRNALSQGLFLRTLNSDFESINMGLDHKFFLQLFFLLPWHFFLSTTKHLEKIRRLGYRLFTLFAYVNGLKKFFGQNQNLTVLKKCPFFSFSLLLKMLKFKRSSLRLVYLNILYNQFLLLKNYRWWHYIRTGMSSVKTPLGTPLRLRTSSSSYFFLQAEIAIKQQWFTLNHWACWLNDSPKGSSVDKKQQVEKNRMK